MTNRAFSANTSKLVINWVPNLLKTVSDKRRIFERLVKNGAFYRGRCSELRKKLLPNRVYSQTMCIVKQGYKLYYTLFDYTPC